MQHLAPTGPGASESCHDTNNYNVKRCKTGLNSMAQGAESCPQGTNLAPGRKVGRGCAHHRPGELCAILSLPCLALMDGSSFAAWCLASAPLPAARDLGRAGAQLRAVCTSGPETLLRTKEDAEAIIPPVTSVMFSPSVCPRSWALRLWCGWLRNELLFPGWQFAA